MRTGRLSILACLVASAGCTGGEDPLELDPPTVTLLSPESGTTVRENLAIAGEATGDLVDVSIRIDSAEPVPATGLEEWFHLLDVTALEDGSHTVAAIATDSQERVAESLAMSFTTTANQPPDTSIWSGLVRNADQELVPGAQVTAFGTTLATESDLNGRYALVGLPRDQEASLLCSATGYQDTYMPRLLPTGDITLDIPLFTNAALDFVADGFGVTRDPGLGAVLGFLLAPLPSQSGYEGAVVALDGSTGAGPFYTTPTGGFDPLLTETTSSGVFLFFNVSPGPVSVTASGGGMSFTVLGSEAAADALTLLFGRAN